VVVAAGTVQTVGDLCDFSLLVPAHSLFLGPQGVVFPPEVEVGELLPAPPYTLERVGIQADEESVVGLWKG